VTDHQRQKVQESIVVFNADGFNTEHERESAAYFIRRLINDTPKQVPIRIAAGFRVPGAEVDLLVATRQRLMIGEMKSWKGKISGRMNGAWTVLTDYKVNKISGESPYQQILRARSRVGKSLENHLEKHKGRGGDLFIPSIHKHPVRISDVIDAGLVQCPELNADIDIDEKWWFAVGLDGLADRVIGIATKEGPIELKAIESWFARLGCLRSPSLNEVIIVLEGGKRGVTFTPSSSDQVESPGLPKSVIANVEKASLQENPPPLGSPRHRGMPALPVTDQVLRNRAESFADNLASRSFKKNLLVRAGPGAGKTHFLARRALRACKNSAGSVAVISYTNAARDEVRKRFETFLAKEKHEVFFDSPFFGTIHQFSRWLLSDDKKDLSEKFHILDEAAARSAYEEIAGVDIPYENFVRCLNKMGEFGLQNNSSYLAIIKCWTDFYQALDERNEASFETMIAKACRAIKDSKTLRELPTSILVDEYQDVTGLQDELFRTLHAKGVHLTVVGDREQSIFSFAGADPSRFYQFQLDFAPADVETIEANWRSAPMIAKWGCDLRTDDLSQFCIGTHDPSFTPPIYVKKFDSARREADWIAGEIERLASLERLDSLLRYNDLAIILRENVTRAFEQAFDRRGIPWKRLGFRAAETKVTERLLAFIDCLAPDAHGVDLSRLVMNWPGAGPKAISLARSHKFDATGISSAFKNSDTDQRVYKLVLELEALRKQGRGRFEQAEDIVKESYRVVKSMLTSGELAEISQHDDDANALFRAATLHLPEWAAPPKNGWVSAREFTQNVRTFGIVQVAEDQDAVVISTIHAAKGGEWEVVFLPSLLNGIIPHRNCGVDHEEERRLLHVGITRAKRQCILSWCPEIPGRGNGCSVFLEKIHKLG
jgi:superfamily I DNA/RNA helicase